MSLSLNYPTVRPSLILDFANTGRLDPRISFTRASPAVYYDGVTTAVAEQNLILESQTFDSISWNKIQATVSADATTAPDGTTTADKLIPTATLTTAHYVRQNVAFIAGLSYTFSIYAKASEYADIRFFARNTAFGVSINVSFNLTTLAVTPVSGTYTYTITNTSNNWVRITITGTTVSTATTDFQWNAQNVAGDVANSGDGTSGIFIWGAQVEQRSAITVYTSTTTQPVTNYVPVLLTAPANTARFDYNPVTGASLGLQIEEVRTNLLADSETLGSNNQATSFNNVAIAPNGTQTADLLVPTAVSAEHYTDKTVAVNSGIAYTFTVYAKTYYGQRLCMRTATQGTAYAFYNLETGVVSTIVGISASMTAVGNGWWRCQLSYTASGTGTAVVRCMTAGPTDTFIYSGNDWAGILLWGWQWEAGGVGTLGAFATSYIATSGGVQTRQADVATMSGTNLTPWYNNAQGTLYGVALTYTTTSSFLGNPVAVASIGDTGNNNRAQIRYNSTVVAFSARLVASGASIIAVGGGTVTPNAFYQQTLAYQSGNTAAAGSGAVYETNSSAFVLANVSTLQIGVGNTSEYLNGIISKLSFYPVRLPNAQLQNITL